MIDLEHVFPTVMFSKKCPCFCRRQFTICTELYDCSLLEMLLERAFLIKSVAGHVKSGSHCERTACVTTSIFCMYAEKMLMRPYVSFHVYIAAVVIYTTAGTHPIQNNYSHGSRFHAKSLYTRLPCIKFKNDIYTAAGSHAKRFLYTAADHPV